MTMVSGPIQNTYGRTGDWLTGATLNDTYYLLDEGSGEILALNLEEGTWSMETLQDSSAEGPRFIYNHDNALFMQPQSGGSPGAVLNYRLEPGSDREKDYSAGALTGNVEQTFEAHTPKIWPVGPGQKITPRYLFVKVYQRTLPTTSYETALEIIPYFDGTAGTTLELGPEATVGTRWYRFSIGEKRRISEVRFVFSHFSDNLATELYDIQEVMFGFNVEQVP